MTLDLGALNVPIRTGAKQANAELRSVNKTGLSVSKSLTRAFAAVGGAYVGLRLVKGLIQITGQFETLQTNLVTVTGSANKATQAFKFLTQFAKETPFDLQGVTRAYTQLVTLGLSPTAEMLTDLGNIAGAWGESLESIAQGVASTTVGITTALRRFGIIANIEGDKVRLTFKGISRTVDRSAEDITRALQEISRESFAGGMERQALTLVGLWSNFKDSVEVAASAIGTQMQPQMKALVRTMTSMADWVVANQASITVWGRVFVAAVKVAWTSLKRVLDLLASVGVAIVLEGKNLGHLANTIRSLAAGQVGLASIYAKLIQPAGSVDVLKESLTKTWDELGTVGEDLAAEWGNAAGKAFKAGFEESMRGNKINAGVTPPDVGTTTPGKFPGAQGLSSGMFALPFNFEAILDNLTQFRVRILDVFQSIYDGMEAVIATGNASIGRVLLGGLGGLFSAMGDQLIAFGVTMEGLQKAFLALGPIGGGAAAIAAGVALKLLGSQLTKTALGPAVPVVGVGGTGGYGGGAGGNVTEVTLLPRGGGFVPQGSLQPAMNHFTVIGPNDPTAQRGIYELIRAGEQRGYRYATP